MGKPYVRQVEVVGLVERLGTILLFDDIEDLFKWAIAGTGVDYVGEKNTTVAYNGSASLRMQTKATTPAAGDYVQAVRWTFVSYGKKVSLECMWRVRTRADTDNLEFTFQYYTGTQLKTARVRWLGPEGIWQYQTSGGAWVDVPGGTQPLREGKFHRMKLIVDFEKNEYVSLQSDDTIWDLSGMSIFVLSSTADITMLVFFTLYAETANRPEVWIDDVLVKEE